MRSFFQQEPGFCLRLLRGLAAFFFSFRAKSQLYNQSSTHSNSHQPGFLTLIKSLNEERGLKNPVDESYSASMTDGKVEILPETRKKTR